MATGYTRRNFFIKKNFQGKLILSTFFFVSGGCLLFIVLLSFFSADTLAIAYNKHDLQLSYTPFILLKQVLTTHWLLVTFGGTVLVFGSLLLSHRIAGPLYRFEKALDSMNLGHIDETIHLRGNDEGKELALKINTFNTRLSQSVRVIHHNSTALETLIEQAMGLDLPEEEKETLASLCWSMHEHNRKIKNTCSDYIPKNE